MIARAIVFTDINSVALGETEIPAPGPGEVLVEAEYTCISPGTELRCLAGRQDGTPGWPFIPGYALAGRVITCGPMTRTSVGTRVLCAGTSQASSHRLWGGHVSHAVQSEAAIFPLPEGMDPLEAVVARLVAIAYHGLRLSRPQPHENVAVIGLGIIGQLSARLHALTGARVVAADLSPRRVEIARQAGIEALVPEGDLADAVRSLLSDGAEVVVDATGLPAVLPACIRIARDLPYDDMPNHGARLLIQGSYAGEFSVPYTAAFRKELAILLPRDRQPRDMRAALDVIYRGKLQVRDLVSRICAPEKAPEVYAALRDPNSGMLTAAFRWQ